MKRDEIDFHYVEPAHEAIHAELENWARWVANNQRAGKSAPMWARCKPSQRWDFIDLHVVAIVIDPLAAAAMEKAIFRLPVKHREAVRWSYYFKWRLPRTQAKRLAVSEEGLRDLVRVARAMLINRRA